MGYPLNSLSSYATGGDGNEPSDEYVKAQERKMKEQEERAKKWREQRDLKMAEPKDV